MIFLSEGEALRRLNNKREGAPGCSPTTPGVPGVPRGPPEPERRGLPMSDERDRPHHVKCGREPSRVRGEWWLPEVLVHGRTAVAGARRKLRRKRAPSASARGYSRCRGPKKNGARGTPGRRVTRCRGRRGEWNPKRRASRSEHERAGEKLHRDAALPPGTTGRTGIEGHEDPGGGGEAEWDRPAGGR